MARLNKSLCVSGLSNLLMPIWEILSVISAFIVIVWISSGPGANHFRLMVGGALLAGVLLCWGLVYFGHLSESASSIVVQLAIADSIAMLVLPVIYRKLVKKNGAA